MKRDWVSIAIAAIFVLSIAGTVFNACVLRAGGEGSDPGWTR